MPDTLYVTIYPNLYNNPMKPGAALFYYLIYDEIGIRLSNLWSSGKGQSLALNQDQL